MLFQLNEVDEEVKPVLVAAQDEARAMGHGYIGTEHVLLGLLGLTGSPLIDQVREAGCTVEQIRAVAQRAFDETEQPWAYVPDEQALASAGIDLHEVRRRAEAQFGPGALPMRVGAPAFTPRVLSALQAAVARAAADAREQASADDLLRALALDGDDAWVATRALRDLGIPALL